MHKNKPIKPRIIKRDPYKTVRDRRDDLRNQFQKADDKIEKLKGHIVTTKRVNNTTRVGAIAATAAGTLAANMIFLQGTSPTDSTLRYAIALGACFGAGLMNKHFNQTDITLTEMLKRVNAWKKQKFAPEDVKSFREMYEQVAADFKKEPSLKKHVKNHRIYTISQGVIITLAMAALASAADKAGYSLGDYLAEQYKGVIEAVGAQPAVEATPETKQKAVDPSP